MNNEYFYTMELLAPLKISHAFLLCLRSIRVVFFRQNKFSKIRKHQLRGFIRLVTPLTVNTA